MTILLWFEGQLSYASAGILTSGFRSTPFAFSVGMAVATKRVRGKGFVASYSSATVAEFHGVPCADVLRHTARKFTAFYVVFGLNLKELGAA